MSGLRFSLELEQPLGPDDRGYEKGNYPRGLVVDSKLALQMLSGDPASSASDEVHGVEPQVQRRRRLVKDRPRCRVNVVAASGASPRLSPLGRLVPLEGPVGFALRAERRLPVRGIARSPEVVEAGCVVRESLHELHERILRFRGLGSCRILAINRRHVAIV